MAIQTVNSQATSNRRLAPRSLSGDKVSSTITEWVRPSEWPALPSITASDEKFVGVYAVWDTDANYVSIKAAGNYTVDWGDGTVEDFNSGVQANHQYSYSNANLTSTSYGYKCAVIVVTPQAGQQLTSLNLNAKLSALPSYTSQWLDIALSLPNCSASGLGIGSPSNYTRLRNLQRARILNIGSCTSLSYLFTNCLNLRKVEFGNTAAVTDMNNMFYNCYSLQSIPLFNTAAVTNMSNMFNNCYSLQSVPLFNTAAVTNMSNMFGSCYSLQTVPLLNTAAVTSMSSMFSSCYSLQAVPLLNTAAVTNMTSMFSSCYSLQTVPLFNTAAVTNMTSMFSSCYSLQAVPLFNTAAVTNMSSMFNNCASLQSIPALVQSGVTSGNGASFASGLVSLASSAATGCKYSINYSGCCFSKTGLETIFTNLGKAYNTSQAVDVGTNYGADTAVSKASSGTTTGSTTVTIANTSSLVTGMICTGTGVSTGVSVTFQDSGDTVTLAGHGLANGTMISFSAITSTTGIVTYTNYWVVNATTDTFQVAATQGGNALALTTNGSGTLLYPAYITAINPNVSVTLSAPASATGTVTLSFRKLDTFKAASKGWVVTG